MSDLSWQTKPLYYLNIFETEDINMMNHKPDCQCASCRSKRGDNPFFGKHHKSESILKMREKQASKESKQQFRETMFKHFTWDKISIETKHSRIARILPKPDCCPMCERTNVRLVLSNVDHEYSANSDDWWWLCDYDHKAFDGVYSFVSEIRKQQRADQNSMYNTKEYAIKMKNSVKKAWKNSGLRKQQGEDTKQRWEDHNSAFNKPDYSKKISDGLKQAYQNPELRKKSSDNAKKRWSSPEYRLKQDIAQKKRWSKK
jgi:hypothetical protein